VGHGSNLLFADEGFDGVCVRIGDGLAEVDIRDRVVRARAGVWVPRLARATAKAGLAGFEHIVGIPGTLGGLVVMNGGSQRQAIGSRVRRIRSMTPQGDVVERSRGDCEFAYRHSVFRGNGEVILEGEFELDEDSPTAVRRRMLDVLRSRRRKFPLKMPNCGSVFVSDPAMYEEFGPPGKVIESLGLKGFRIGDACVSPVHANFFVNLGRATSRDMLRLIRHVQETVLTATGYRLRAEVLYVASDGTFLPADVAASRLA
jgi:UDP-N-acetylmuramate dehydrogenase